MSASEVLAFVLAASAVACTDAVAVPDPPDMSPLIASYEEPSGTFDRKDPGPVLDRSTAQLAILAGGDVSSFLTDLMGVIAERLDGSGIASSGSSVRMDAVLSLDFACPKDRGTIAITTVLRDNELSRVMWGKAVKCAVTASIGSSVLAIDGSVAIYRYGDVGATASDASFLVRVDGTVATGADERKALDFRVRAGAVETRVATSAGDVIVARHGTDLGVRAANGSFTCSIARRSCSSL